MKASPQSALQQVHALTTSSSDLEIARHALQEKVDALTTSSNDRATA